MSRRNLQTMIVLLVTAAATPVLAGDWREAAEQRILQHRTAMMEVVVHDAAGQPVPDASVEVELTRPAFLFGASVDAELLSDRPDRKMPYAAPHMLVLVPTDGSKRVNPTGLPAGAQVFVLAPGGPRTADYGFIASIPTVLRNALAVSVPRGDKNRPATGYRVTVDKPVDAYLFVQDYGKTDIPGLWKPAHMSGEWARDPLHYTDRVYKAHFNAGVINVPPHNGNPDLISKLNDDQIQQYRRRVGQMLAVASVAGLPAPSKLSTADKHRVAQVVNTLSGMRLGIIVPDAAFLGRPDMATVSANVGFMAKANPNKQLGINKYVFKPGDVSTDDDTTDGKFQFFAKAENILTSPDNRRERMRRESAERYLRGLIEARVEFDAIALDEKFNVPTPKFEQIEQRLNKLAEFGKPIVITSLRIDDGDYRVAEQVARDAMLLLYSHPAVTGIVADGFWDSDTDQSSAQLFDHSWMPKPLGKAWQELVEDAWKTRGTTKTDAQGRAAFNGHLGKYMITVTVAGQSHVAEAYLTRGGSRVEIELNSAVASAGR